VEEIIENAENAEKDIKRLFFLIEKVKIKLFLQEGDNTEDLFVPKKYSLDRIFAKHPFIFLALHGGIGEDGTIQKILEKAAVDYNGSGSFASRLCMDKWVTNEILEHAGIAGVSVAKHVLLQGKDISKITNVKSADAYWNMLLKKLKINSKSRTIIAKPRGDGCTAGVVRLFNKKDLSTYLSLIKNKVSRVSPNTFTNQVNTIDMPEGDTPDIIFESFIESNKIKVKGGKLVHVPKSGYIEMTVGVIEEKGKIRALSPSITVAEMAILSVEEKFQGGTGVNITPPPREIISARNMDKVKNLVEKVAEKTGVKGYARIDIFVHVKTGNIIVIEINTLPGLTPSTVLFHQALAEKRPMFPTEFLELLIKNKGY
jgi:D-alanine-D-alanine ligase-like ATP-grasp enzyme